MQYALRWRSLILCHYLHPLVRDILQLRVLQVALYGQSTATNVNIFRCATTTEANLVFSTPRVSDYGNKPVRIGTTITYLDGYT